MKDLLEYIIIYLVFCYGLFVVVVAIKKISEFLETKKYKAKLKKIAPHIKSINTEELSAKLLSTKESYSELIDQIQQRYGTADEQWTDIRRYQEEEALYTRRIGDVM